MNSIRVSEQSYLFPQLYTNAEFIAQSRHCAALSLYTAGSCALCWERSWRLLDANPKALFGVIGLATVEMFLSAYQTRATSDSATFVNSEEKRFLADHPGDYRIMNVADPNSAMILGAQDMWGYDATVVDGMPSS